MHHPHSIAIVGMSGIFPGAANVQAFWENITGKKDAIETVPQHRIPAVYFDAAASGATDRFYCRRGGFIDAYASFNPVPFGILPIAVEGTEPEHLLSLQLAHDALKDAGVFRKQLSLGDTGIVIGKGNYSGTAATRAIEIVRTGEQLVQLLQNALPHLSAADLQTVKQSYQQQKGRFGTDTVMGLIPNLVASLVANRLDLGGTAYTVDAACASSLLAVHQAIQELESGRCNMMLAGGVHACQNAPFWSIFSQLGALSRAQQIRPFDTWADGLLIGEGCGFVVLKKLDDALRDGHTIYAVIKGTGISSDGAGTSVMSPSVKGQVKAITQAWNNAGLSVQQVGYIEAHGTGTPLGDKTELATLQEVFGFNDALPRAGMGSVKSNIGHAMPAAGIAGLIKTALALYHGVLPPTLHCNNPLPALQQTRFMPVQDATDWDATGLPRIAGVNAFGFGGINAHVVLQGFEAPVNTIKKSTAIKGFAGRDAVLLLARNSQQALLDALQHNEQHTGEGDYRIALFDPTPERIQKAIKIVTRNNAWRNRQDIWFTHTPLLRNGGKLAFVFPGLDALSSGETASIARHFNLPVIDRPQTKENELLHGVFAAIESSRHIDAALKQLDIHPDVIAGHSLGEWLGWGSAGMVEDASVLSLLQQLNPASYQMEHSRFVAVGCGYQQLQPLLAQIDDLYLSNDNCPQQVILCGTPAAVEQLTQVLQQQQVFHQVLPFSSGFHSPFVASHMDLLLHNLDAIQFKPGHTPLWSATSLQPYPQHKAGIRALTIQHLTHTVRFRELTERLYEEGVRVFIQTGAGGLTGFVEDTLKQKTYSAIAASVPARSGMQQLQRVLAALFTEGKNIPPEWMGVTPTETPVAGKAIPLQLGSPFVRDWQVLAAMQPAPPAVLTGTALPSWMQAPAHAHNPVLQSAQNNFALLHTVQDELLQLLQQTPAVQHAAPAIPVQEPEYVPANFTRPLTVSLHHAPYLTDHSLMRQKPGWPQMEDLEPVIPMTMTLDLLAEAAAAAAPRKQVLQLNDVQVFQWMSVATPFNAVINGSWKNAHTLQLSIDNYTRANAITGDCFPSPASIHEDTGTPLPVQLDRELIYRRHMFHGPAYQGIEQVTAIGHKGISGIISGGEGKGSLLDNAGQLFGLWLQLTLPVEKIAFPVNIREVNYYDDFTQQQGRFTCTCVLTALTDEFATADFILRRNNRVWAVIKGWQNRRLEIDDKLWLSCIEPLQHALAEEIAPGVFFFFNRYQRVSSWNFILKRYFTLEERAHRAQLAPKKQKQWAISRIAVKDAVRSALQQHKQLRCYQNEFTVTTDETGRPYVNGAATAGIHISLAHKDTDAVAIARYGEPVGIDIELVAPRSAGFKELVFTDAEWALIAHRDPDEWMTRCWVAKEAYSKYTGTGLGGNPKQYEIQAIEDNRLRINETWITTIQYQNYIIGWTH